jgi:anti-sigma factor RsiW
MNGPVTISDDEIQDFIDERLDPLSRAAFRARLGARPELGARVEAMRRQQRALRQIGQEVLYEPVPPRLRRILQRRGGNGSGNGSRPARRARSFGLTTATAAILAGCVGGGFAF